MESYAFDFPVYSVCTVMDINAEKTRTIYAHDHVIGPTSVVVDHKCFEVCVRAIYCD